MKKTIFTILIFLLPTLLFAQWAISVGGNFDDAGTSIAVDIIGNTYITGHFEGTADFDPGVGTVNLNSNGSFDIFIAKYAADGSFVWAKNFGGAGDDAGSSIFVESDGTVYVTGGFEGTVNFNPGGSTFNLVSSGGADIFIAKYASDGSFVLAKSVGGSSYDAGSNISVDGSGNIYVTGFFANIADFDPGGSKFNLASVGGVDIFIAKYSSDGNFIWAKSVGSPLDDAGSTIAVDNNGDIYIVGFFEGTADFDTGEGTFNLATAGLYDIFISKYSSDGNYIWAKSVGGPSYDLGHGWIDNSGNIYVTGAFEGTVDFNPGTDIFNLTSSGASNAFIAKYSSNGNFVWAKNIEGSGEGVGISADGNGNIYVTGAFEGVADFNPGTGIFNLTSTGQIDVFIAKYTSEGSFVWAKNLGGAEDDLGYSIAVDGSGNTYVTGNFQSTADFDPEAGKLNLTSNGDYDIFIAKYQTEVLSGAEVDFSKPTDFELSQNYPNPFNPTTTISYSIPTVVDANFASTTNVQLKIYDTLGKEVATLVNKQQPAGNYKVEFDASKLTSGIYFYTIRSGSFLKTKKMLLIK